MNRLYSPSNLINYLRTIDNHVDILRALFLHTIYQSRKKSIRRIYTMEINELYDQFTVLFKNEIHNPKWQGLIVLSVEYRKITPTWISNLSI